MIYNKEQIKEIIPHRYEMLLIDKILEINPGESIVGRRYIKEDDWYFRGHFPEEPVMPGVLMVEASAQVGAVLLLSEDENKGKIAYFGGIDKVRFKQKVVPGDTLDFRMEMISRKGPVGKGKVRATNQNGKTVFTGELMFAIGK